MTSTYSVAQVEQMLASGTLGSQKVEISDSAANVFADLDGLQKLAASGGLLGVALTDQTFQNENLSPQQFANDAGVLSLLSAGNLYWVSVANISVAQALSLGSLNVPNAHFAISDSSANVLANLDALEALVNTPINTASVSVTLSDTSTLTLSAVQVAKYFPLLEGFADTTFTVSDTVANVIANLTPLEFLHNLTGITITDSVTAPLSLDAVSSPQLGVFTQASGNFKLALTGAASTVSNDLSILQSLYAAGHIASITVSDAGMIALDSSQLVDDAGVLGALTGTYGLRVQGNATEAAAAAYIPHLAQLWVADTSANVFANLDRLEAVAADPHVSLSVGLTDFSTPVISLTPAQQVKDAAALWTILSESRGVTINGTSAGVTPVAVTLAPGQSVNLASLFGVSGTLGGGVYLDVSLPTADSGSLSVNGQIKSSPGEYEFSASDLAKGITYTAPTNQGAATIQFDLWTGSSWTDWTTETITVAGQATAAAAASAYASGQTSSISTVLDSAANILTNLDALQGLAAKGGLTSITLTDTTSPTMVVSAVQAVNDLQALELISGSHAVQVKDTAGHVGANLDTLEALYKAGSLASITLVDDGAVAITGGQFAADAGALGVISSPHSLVVTNASVAQAASLASSLTPASVSVLDSAANVSANLNSLEILAAAHKLTGITLTDSGPVLLSLTQEQQTEDAAALSAISGKFSVVTIPASSGLSAGGPTSSGTSTGGNHLVPIAQPYAVGETIQVSSLFAVTSANAVSDYAFSLAGNGTINLNGATNLASLAQTQAGQIVVSAADLPKLTLSGFTEWSNFSTLTAYTYDTAGWSSGMPLWLSPAEFSAVVIPQPVSLAPGQSVNLASLFHVWGASGSDLLYIVDLSSNPGGSISSNGQPNMATNAVPGYYEFSAAELANGITYTAPTNPGVVYFYIGLTNSTPVAPIDESKVTITVGTPDAAGAVVAYTDGQSAPIPTVADSAANIAANLDALQGLVAKGTLAGITLTDATTPTMALSAVQVGSDAKALQVISNAYQVAVTDTARNVTVNLDSLESLAATHRLSSIALTDSGVPTLSLTASQMQSDAAALADISTDYSLVVSIPASASGSQVISGVAGHAMTVVVSGDAAQWTVTPTGNGSGISLSNGAVSEQISGANVLQFADADVILASQTPATAGGVSSFQIASLYAAVFGRLPDAAGLAYYETLAATSAAKPITSFAQSFLSSPEYTGNPSHDYAQSAAGDTQFVTDIYVNLLHRAPGSSEASWYLTNVIDPILAGTTPGTAAYTAAELQAHAAVLTYVSQSPEFKSDVQVTAQNPASAQHWLILI